MKTKHISITTLPSQRRYWSAGTFCGHPLNLTLFFQFRTTRDKRCPKINGVYRLNELISPRAIAGPKIKAIRHHDIPMFHTLVPPAVQYRTEKRRSGCQLLHHPQARWNGMEAMWARDKNPYEQRLFLVKSSFVTGDTLTPAEHQTWLLPGRAAKLELSASES